MSTSIRLKRFGSKKRPYYRLVVIDSQAARDSRSIEEVGQYHPIEAEDKQVVLKEDRIKDWIAKGAQPSATVKKILNKHHITLNRTLQD
ncbi:MAG TPA: 30S ribosomal protein S16 [Sphaerochaeta sp.]|nr:30S ribosomal protein S16 [Sphaerochaeta sp.]OHD32764.1 MAG: 30S ribosomal protein S16 [Spirochaetes bacterium GWC2_52_13]OHD68807.1 MAG: 30S ribosomal protein S16 [Spirochaetes bacterium GWF2_52_7]PKL21645.1 MAG: 30S ribosomal protein S16 [Spirochaetae bacterium HGW-Spirochaetae-4]PKL29039.1 MAG: 30S ribosomal protein S16 [Spirochaetae bacterium HGW-Spirochaetae-2]